MDTCLYIICAEHAEQKAKCKLNQSLEAILVFDRDGCIIPLLWEIQTLFLQLCLLQVMGEKAKADKKAEQVGVLEAGSNQMFMPHRT